MFFMTLIRSLLRRIWDRFGLNQAGKATLDQPVERGNGSAKPDGAVVSAVYQVSGDDYARSMEDRIRDWSDQPFNVPVDEPHQVTMLKPFKMHVASIGLEKIEEPIKAPVPEAGNRLLYGPYKCNICGDPIWYTTKHYWLGRRSFMHVHQGGL